MKWRRHRSNGDIRADNFNGKIGWSNVEDVSISNSDIASDAAIDFSKIAVSASDLQGAVGYTGGTGVQIVNSEVKIGQEVSSTANVEFASVTVNGVVKAVSFVGNGSGLTGSHQQITDETISADSIAADAVGSEIAANAVGSSEIAAECGEE